MATEFELIEAIRERFPTPAGVEVGIGDDAAVLSDHFEVVTTDLLAERVHFRFDWCDPEDVGWRAVTASLSDAAAMGARPGPYVVSLALGPDDREERARRIVEGLAQRRRSLPSDAQSTPVGGDLSSSPGPVFLSVTLFGRLEGNRPLLRSGAQVGDAVVLVGAPGCSAAGIAALENDSATEAGGEFLVEAYRRPRAEVVAGRALGRTGIPSACIDVSDGLAADLGHVTEASGVGANIELADVPIDADLRRWCRQTDRDPMEFVLTGGEDFCLLATVPPGRLEELEEVAEGASWSYAVIGDIVGRDSGVRFLDENSEPIGLDTGGYEHFSRR